MLYVFASVNVVTSQLHTKAVACRTGLYRRTGESKTRRLQRAFAEHLRPIAVRDPAEKHPRVVRIIDNARGTPATAFERRRTRTGNSSARPVTVRNSTRSSGSGRCSVGGPHNRLFDTIADLKRSIRNSLSYFQTVRSRI